jgi:hypothetical protein
MSRYFAEVSGGLVQRVIVAETQEWCEEHLGGTWVETADPYTTEPQTIAYCGPGMGYADNLPSLFAPQWTPWDGTFDEANLTPYQVGTVVWHNGRLWRSTTPNNVWEPGVSGWHDAPDTGHPAWVQPTGAHDAYALGVIVTHIGKVWESLYNANVWEPGVFGWSEVT